MELGGRNVTSWHVGSLAVEFHGSCGICFAARSFWQGSGESLWPEDNVPTGMPYHHLPGGLLCFWEFWRSQRKDEVSLFFLHTEKIKNLFFSFFFLALFPPSSYLLYQWGPIAYPSVSVYFAGILQSQLPVPSPSTSIPTHGVLRFWKTPEVLKMWCRISAAIWTPCVMPWTKWTSIWGFDAQDQCCCQHDPVGLSSQCHITPITPCAITWLVGMQLCISLPACNLLC